MHAQAKPDAREEGQTLWWEDLHTIIKPQRTIARLDVALDRSGIRVCTIKSQVQVFLIKTEPGLRGFVGVILIGDSCDELIKVLCLLPFTAR